MQRATQAERILTLLQAHEGEFIPAYSLVNISLRYGARIYELRKLGHQIEIKQEMKNGQVHSAYRLINASTATPEPLDALLGSWYERMSPNHKTEET